MDKKRSCKKIQAQINKNNAHIDNEKLYFYANKKERKQMRAQENTTPLIRWTNDKFK